VTWSHRESRGGEGSKEARLAESGTCALYKYRRMPWILGMTTALLPNISCLISPSLPLFLTLLRGSIGEEKPDFLIMFFVKHLFWMILVSAA